MNLRNKKVVVTGASSGIGFELVKKLLAEKCTVVAVVKNHEPVKLKSQRLHVLSCDVSKPEELDRLFVNALAIMGTIDIFVANAGFAYYEKLATPDWSHLSTIFQTNTLSVLYCAQKMNEIHEHMPYQFITTASGMAHLSLPGYALYSSTKAAIRGFADAYRYELERGQIFQVVYPIATRTAFFKQAGNSPVPHPSQSSKAVASSILNGIKKKKNSIYTSRLFILTLTVGRLLPIITRLYTYVEYMRFKNWLKKKGDI
ncbi:hypothetical protein acsn021_15090 [Anaerocolumna cellulosilytica]|uniref:Uncharacterized protein n=1 Tax=Anaerocolumna cellulosilytica TaxID=433286 RepID=A0A6S6R3K3_9FIRM|nr:SDR family NAD(P)-dependent oxidoreductase [Anaerocolumna cellulosilytica]MBB5196678.1 short-subunit dehydrogenase [Anaerocolumna cellulosilytica]BCJ93940.1 hypothetical protein acsn021_15090 [Anaerocolumna cellulosilytica]